MAQSPDAAPAIQTTAVTQQLTSQRYPPVAEVGTITTRASGRPEKFADASNREFRVHYRSDGKVESVGATRGRHASDVEQIIYSPTGQIWEVHLGNGYTLFFVYTDNGTQVIRDQFGGVITRGGPSQSAGTQSVQADPSGRLAPALAGLDALLAAIAR